MALTTDVGRRFREVFEPFEDVFHTSVLSPLTSPLAAAAMPFSGRNSWMTAARMDVIDKSNHYLVYVELPGVSKDDIQVHIDGGRLFIQAKKNEEALEENDRMYLSERSYGRIRRTIEMPGSVDPSKIEASCDNGVLKVLVGKQKSAYSGKIVPVQ